MTSDHPRRWSRLMAVSVLLAVLATVTPTVADARPPTVTTVVELNCGPRGIEISADGAAIGGLVLVSDGVAVRIEEPFESAELYEWSLDPDDHPDLDTIYVKAGNNGTRGPRNRGLGEAHQADLDGACDPDGDGVDSADGDNCPALSNPLQDDLDGDGSGDACDLDGDGDGFEGALGDGSDCDDLDPAINPGIIDWPADGVDQDCDGADDQYAAVRATGDESALGVLGSGEFVVTDEGTILAARAAGGFVVTVDPVTGATRSTGVLGDYLALGADGPVAGQSGLTDSVTSFDPETGATTTVVLPEAGYVVSLGGFDGQVFVTTLALDPVSGGFATSRLSVIEGDTATTLLDADVLRGGVYLNVQSAPGGDLFLRGYRGSDAEGWTSFLAQYDADNGTVEELVSWPWFSGTGLGVDPSTGLVLFERSVANSRELTLFDPSTNAVETVSSPLVLSSAESRILSGPTGTLYFTAFSAERDSAGRSPIDIFALDPETGGVCALGVGRGEGTGLIGVSFGPDGLLYATRVDRARNVEVLTIDPSCPA